MTEEENIWPWFTFMCCVRTGQRWIQHFRTMGEALGGPSGRLIFPGGTNCSVAWKLSFGVWYALETVIQYVTPSLPEARHTAWEPRCGSGLSHSYTCYFPCNIFAPYPRDFGTLIFLEVLVLRHRLLISPRPITPFCMVIMAHPEDLFSCPARDYKSRFSTVPYTVMWLSSSQWGVSRMMQAPSRPNPLKRQSWNLTSFFSTLLGTRIHRGQQMSLPGHADATETSQSNKTEQDGWDPGKIWVGRDVLCPVPPGSSELVWEEITTLPEPLCFHISSRWQASLCWLWLRHPEGRNARSWENKKGPCTSLSDLVIWCPLVTASTWGGGAYCVYWVINAA